MEKEIFRDIYNLLLKYLKRPLDNNYWKDLIRDGGKIEEKHKTELCVNLLTAVWLHLEEVKKGEKKCV